MGKRFRIAFSFAGENRLLVEETAELLATQFGRDSILYDKFHQAEFARADLAFYLPDLYEKETDLVVLVFCDDYEHKKWCGLEWRAIFSLIMGRNDQDVMLMRFNRLEPKDLRGLAGFIDVDHLSPAQVADFILERLALNEGRPKDHYAAGLRELRSAQPAAQALPDPAAPLGPLVVVRSFPPRGPDPSALALPPLDFTDLFHGRHPIHEDVWTCEVPRRVAELLPALALQPQPLLIALQTHLSIGWYWAPVSTPRTVSL